MTCFSIQKSLKFLILTLCFAALASLPAHARKDDQAVAPAYNGPVVLELFTASDCNACIFADRMLYDAIKDKQIIALSCHIKDISALSGEGDEAGEFRDGASGLPMDSCIFRQWAFMSERSSRNAKLTIPTFFLNGQDSTSGSSLNYFADLLHDYSIGKRGQPVQEVVMKWKDGDTVSVQLPKAASTDASVSASIWIVRYKDMAVEKMDEGINKGRVLRFSNIIQNITHLGRWHGDARTIDIDVAVPQGGKERGGYAILVSKLLGSPYLAAGQLKDYPVEADLKEEAERRARAQKDAEKKLQGVPVQAQPPSDQKSE